MVSVKHTCAGFNAYDRRHSDKIKSSEAFFSQIFLCLVIPFSFRIIKDQNAVRRQVTGGKHGAFYPVAAINNNNMIKILALTLEEKDPEKVKVFLKTVCALANKLDEF